MESINKIEKYFLGSLFSTNYENLGIEEQKKILIEKKIYVLDEDDYLDTFKIELNGEPYKRIISENEFNLGDPFFYENKKFSINNLFLKELFESVRSDVYGTMEQLLDIKMKEINLHAKHIEKFSDVNEFYKTQYREHYEKISENEYFFMYNEPRAWNYSDWEDFITTEIMTNSFLIKKYLLTEYFYTAHEEISLEWQDLYYYSEIINFLKEKLEGCADTTLSKLIFKENGEEIFNHIALNYKEKKSQAFFNYLYYFLLDVLKKLKLEEEHSNTYTSYVVKKGYLKEYGRMQKARASNKKTHTRMMDLFQEMYSAKFEQIMSKDE